MNENSILTEEEEFGASNTSTTTTSTATSTTTTTTPTTTTTTTTVAPPPLPPTTTTTTTTTTTPSTTTTTSTLPSIICGNPVICSNVNPSWDLCDQFTNWDAQGVNGNLLTNCRLYGKMCWWPDPPGSGQHQVAVNLFPDTTYTSGTFVFTPWETRMIYRDYPELNSSTIVFYPAAHLGMTGSITVDFTGLYWPTGCYYFNLQLTSQ